MKLRFVPTHPIIFNTIKYYFTSVWNTELKATIFSLNYHFHVARKFVRHFFR